MESGPLDNRSRERRLGLLSVVAPMLDEGEVQGRRNLDAPEAEAAETPAQAGPSRSA